MQRASFRHVERLLSTSHLPRPPCSCLSPPRHERRPHIHITRMTSTTRSALHSVKTLEFDTPAEQFIELLRMAHQVDSWRGSSSSARRMCDSIPRKISPCFPGFHVEASEPFVILELMMAVCGRMPNMCVDKQPLLSKLRCFT